MEIVHLTKDNFNSVLETDKTVLIDFWAPWCQPCRMLGPVLEEIAASRDDVVIAKVNCDEQEELAATFKVYSIPAMFIIKNKKVVNQAVGFRPKEDVEALLK